MNDHTPRTHPVTTPHALSLELANSSLPTLPHKHPNNFYLSTYCPTGHISSACLVIFHPLTGRYYEWRYKTAAAALEKIADIREELIVIDATRTTNINPYYREDFFNLEFVPLVTDTKAQEE